MQIKAGYPDKLWSSHLKENRERIVGMKERKRRKSVDLLVKKASPLPEQRHTRALMSPEIAEGA